MIKDFADFTLSIIIPCYNEEDNIEDSETFNEDLQISNNQENATSDDQIISNVTETSTTEQQEETKSIETSVRRLSLFDNIAAEKPSTTFNQEQKSEPVISERIEESADGEDKDSSIEIEEKLDPEFSVTSDEVDEDFNQETEEELLDIPTFLRRQAN